LYGHLAYMHINNLLHSSVCISANDFYYHRSYLRGFFIVFPICKIVTLLFCIAKIVKFNKSVRKRFLSLRWKVSQKSKVSFYSVKSINESAAQTKVVKNNSLRQNCSCGPS